MRCLLPAALGLIFLAGCAHYEYDLVSPEELARHVGSKGDKLVHRDPLVYRLRSYDNHLVMRIENPTDDPIRLLGEQSYAVDPGGQSHPLRGQTAAPRSFIKLIFPPPRPYYRSNGPNIGFGIGVGVGRFYRPHHYWGPGGFYDPWYFDEPRYYTLYEPEGIDYWDWEGETAVRVHLVYARGSESLVHEFTFQRRKM